MSVLIDWEKLSKADEELFRLAKQADGFKGSEYGAYIYDRLSTLGKQSVEGVVLAVNNGDDKASKTGASLIAGIDALYAILEQPLYEAEALSNDNS